MVLRGAYLKHGKTPELSEDNPHPLFFFNLSPWARGSKTDDIDIKFVENGWKN